MQNRCIAYKSAGSIVRNIKILIKFIRRLVSGNRIWYDAITFKEERYRVYAVSFLFSFLSFVLGKEVAYGGIFRSNGTA